MAVTSAGPVIIMNATGDEHFFWRGSYQIITRLNGGTASLQVRFEGGNATPSDFEGGTLSDNSKLLSFSNGGWTLCIYKHRHIYNSCVG